MKSAPVDRIAGRRAVAGKGRGTASRWLPVLLYCLAIFAQSSHPPPEGLPFFPGADKLVHAAGYALLAALFFRALHRPEGGRRAARTFLLAAVFASCYGFSDEAHQHFVPSRTADVLDAAADVLGSLAGAGACLLWVSRRKTPKRRSQGR